MKPKRIDRFFISKAWKLKNTDPGQAMMFAKAHFEKGVELKDTMMMANAHVTKGTIYQIVSDYPRSVTELLDAIKLYRELNDSLRMAIALSNLGNTYWFTKDYDKAIASQEQALKIRIDKKDSSKIRTSYINIATIAYSRKDYKSALELTAKAFKYPSQSKDELMTIYGNYAGFLAEMKQFDSAFAYTEKLKVLVQSDSTLLSKYHATLGGIYAVKKDLKKAEYHYLQAAALMRAVNDIVGLRAQDETMYALYKSKGDYKTSLQYYENYINQRDSTNSQQKIFQIEFLNAEFGLNQKEAELNDLRQKSILDEKEKSRIRVVRNSVIGGIILTLLLVFVSYRKSNERKKLLVEIAQKNSEITDSINYAKHIQNSFLPSTEKINKAFKDAFVLYEPKDIIAGDFYWLEEKDDNIWFALADCTGHGVPGALVSVVCCNALNRAIGEFGLVKPGEILDQARKIVVKRFSENNTSVKDGMDITLIRIDKKTIGTGKTSIQFAGANNSLCLVTNGEVKKILANKQPIGYVDYPIPFGTRDLEITSSDTLYFFTDGFADQFGGPKGKKFKYKQLLEIIRLVSGKPLAEQKDIFSSTFKKWKGNLEQVDDVCVVGIKLL